MLLHDLVKRNLSELYPESSNKIFDFHVNGKKYSFTQKNIETIKLYLQSKLEDYFVQDKEQFFIAGGSVLTLLMYGSPLLINDIDIFPRTKADYDAIHKKLMEKVTLVTTIIENKNSKTFKFSSCSIDLIKRESNSIQELLDSFDLNVTKFGFDWYWNFHKRTFLEDIFRFSLTVSEHSLKKENVYKILHRINKYSQKGFKISNHELSYVYALLSPEVKSMEDANFTKVRTEIYEKLIEDYKSLIDGQSIVHEDPTTIMATVYDKEIESVFTEDLSTFSPTKSFSEKYSESESISESFEPPF